MIVIKSFDVVKAVVDEFVLNSGEKYSIDEEKFDILSNYCDVIDNILKECFGEQVTVDITANNRISISIILSSFIYETKFKPKAYIDLIERAIEINFDRVKEDRLSMEFVFPSVFIQNETEVQI